MENYQYPRTGIALAPVGHRDASEGVKASTPQTKQPAESRPEIPQSLLCPVFFFYQWPFKEKQNRFKGLCCSLKNLTSVPEPLSAAVLMLH